MGNEYNEGDCGININIAYGNETIVIADDDQTTLDETQVSKRICNKNFIYLVDIAIQSCSVVDNTTESLPSFTMKRR